MCSYEIYVSCMIISVIKVSYDGLIVKYKRASKYFDAP